MAAVSARLLSTAIMDDISALTGLPSAPSDVPLAAAAASSPSPSAAAAAGLLLPLALG